MHHGLNAEVAPPARVGGLLRQLLCTLPEIHVQLHFLPGAVECHLCYSK